MTKRDPGAHTHAHICKPLTPTQFTVVKRAIKTLVCYEINKFLGELFQIAAWASRTHTHTATAYTCVFHSYIDGKWYFQQLKTLLTCCSRPVPFWLIALLILSSNQLLFFSCFPFRKILQWLRFEFFFWMHTCNLRQKNVYDRCVGVALCVYTFFLSFSDKKLLTFHKLLRSRVKFQGSFRSSHTIPFVRLETETFPYRIWLACLCQQLQLQALWAWKMLLLRRVHVFFRFQTRV